MRLIWCYRTYCDILQCFLGRFREIWRQPEDQKLLETKEGWPRLRDSPLRWEGNRYLIKIMHRTRRSFALIWGYLVHVGLHTSIFPLSQIPRWFTTLPASWPRTGTCYRPTSCCCWGRRKTSSRANLSHTRSPKQVKKQKELILGS